MSSGNLPMSVAMAVRGCHLATRPLLGCARSPTSAATHSLNMPVHIRVAEMNPACAAEQVIAGAGGSIDVCV